MRNTFNKFWRRYAAVVLVTTFFLLIGASALDYAQAAETVEDSLPGQTIPPVRPFTQKALDTKIRPGDTVAYQITFDNSTVVTYSGALIGITNTLPAGLVLLEPISASAGTPTFVHGNLFTWTGAPAYGDFVTITYEAYVMSNQLTATLTTTAELWEQRGPPEWITPTNRILTATSVIQVQPLWPEAYLPSLGAPPPATPTPTPLPPVNVPQLVNWNFEQGNNGAWTEQSNNNAARIIYRNGEKITLVLPPYKGQENLHFAWLGGEYSAVNVLEQTINLPSDLAQAGLVFDAWIESADECGPDVASVLVSGKEIGSFLLCKKNQSVVKPGTGGWNKQYLDLSNYAQFAGRSVPIRFQVRTNESKNSNWYIDNVRLCSTDARVAQDRCE